MERPYVSVRFGNVLGSRGSVISTFQAQAASGGPLTVTHPEVTRFFMTVREAVQLVIHAAAIATGGEVLVLDMGEPVRITDVARRVADMVDPEIGIRYTGLRSGEKLHEALFGATEHGIIKVHPLISRVDVPPLAPSQALRIDANTSPAEVVDEMRTLCAAPQGRDQALVDLEHVIDLTRVRQWSGPERRDGERRRLLGSKRRLERRPKPQSHSSSA
jgi:FlaA1/EpsC-like NDP-sugar epimerase